MARQATIKAVVSTNAPERRACRRASSKGAAHRRTVIPSSPTHDRPDRRVPGLARGCEVGRRHLRRGQHLALRRADRERECGCGGARPGVARTVTSTTEVGRRKESETDVATSLFVRRQAVRPTIVASRGAKGRTGSGMGSTRTRRARAHRATRTGLADHRCDRAGRRRRALPTQAGCRACCRP
jgi:hypothetical protein